MDKLALGLIVIGIIMNSLSIHFVIKRNTIQDNSLFSILNIMDRMNNILLSINEDYEKLNEIVERLKERETRWIILLPA